MDWEQVGIHSFVPPPRGMGAAMSFWTISVVSALSSRPATVSCGARGLDHVHWQAFCRWGFLSFTRYDAQSHWHVLEAVGSPTKFSVGQ